MSKFGKPHNIVASSKVKSHVADYMPKHLPEYNLVEVWRKNNYKGDEHLYVVLAELKEPPKYFPVENKYAVWTAWNEATQSLNFGHYNLAEELVDEVLEEHLSSDMYKPIGDEYVHHTKREKLVEELEVLHKQQRGWQRMVNDEALDYEAIAKIPLDKLESIVETLRPKDEPLDLTEGEGLGR